MHTRKISIRTMNFSTQIHEYETIDNFWQYFKCSPCHLQKFIILYGFHQIINCYIYMSILLMRQTHHIGKVACFLTFFLIQNILGLSAGISMERRNTGLKGYTWVCPVNTCYVVSRCQYCLTPNPRAFPLKTFSLNQLTKRESKRYLKRGWAKQV